MKPTGISAQKQKQKKKDYIDHDRRNWLRLRLNVATA